MQGRERVTLQRTQNIPEAELAPFHHLQGKSHKEHHAYLKRNPKPDVRDLVKEREWRLRNGHTSPSKNVTLVARAYNHPLYKPRLSCFISCYH